MNISSARESAVEAAADDLRRSTLEGALPVPRLVQRRSSAQPTGWQPGSEDARAARLMTIDPDVRHELIKLIQRVFLPLGGGDVAPSVVFAALAPSPDEATCSMTAQLLSAQTGGTVCLVDANLRSPSLHRRFGVDNTAGFSDVLAGSRQAASLAVRLTHNFFVVPAGPRGVPAPPSGDVCRQAVGRLLAAFDFVLIDTSSTAVQPNTVALAAAADGVVLVVDRETTHRDAARRVAETLQASDARVLGAVLTNCQPARFPTWGPRR